MVRTVLYLLVGIFVISIVRLLVGTIGKALKDATGPEASSNRGEKPESVPRSGELKKCAVCGTYAPESSGPKLKSVPVFLCSEECAAKYRA